MLSVEGGEISERAEVGGRSGTHEQAVQPQSRGSTSCHLFFTTPWRQRRVTMGSTLIFAVWLQHLQLPLHGSGIFASCLAEREEETILDQTPNAWDASAHKKSVKKKSCNTYRDV